MALNTLKDLFINRLNDIYDAEKQVAEALPGMARAVSNPDLKNILMGESESSRSQVARLDRIFKSLGVVHDHVSSDGMRGIIREGKEFMHEPGNPSVKDAALISIAREMKHYEIAAYGSVRTWAREMDYSDIANMLQDSFDEEGDADKKLTKLAEGGLLDKKHNGQAPR